ncbi:MULTISPECIES: flagellar filament capping protein FliD [unclassified Nitrospina]|uniref:flagellar filament capping protein FliD n=1 Tax=unclassified Nitrospina TaxID=2638683 RepID=UPI003F9861BB
MAITSIFGLQSGFNTSEVVEKLIALQQRPLEAKVSDRELEVEKLDLLKEFRGLLNTFKSTVRLMNVRDRLVSIDGSFVADTSGGENARVGVTTTLNSPIGTYSIDVNQLAQNAIVESDDLFNLTTSTFHTGFTNGTLNVTVGGVANNLTIAPGATLQEVTDQINNNVSGVTATIVDTGSSPDPYRLVITGDDEGSANTVSVSFTPGFFGAARNFSDVQVAQDALFDFEGISYTRSTNIVSDVLTGTTLSLEALGPGTIQITQDTEAIRGKVDDFVEQYNAIRAFVNQNAKFDSDTLEAGPLFGNVSVRSLEQSLARLVSSEVQGLSTSFSFLSQVGIRTGDDGLLELDEAELSSALASDPTGVVNLFINSGSASNPNVTFGSAASTTEEGTFELQVTGGVPELRKVGESTFTPAVAGPGDTFIGAAGTTAEGLVFSITPSELAVDGSKGTIEVSLGVAEKLNRIVTFNTDTTLNSPLQGDINTTTGTIEDLNETILRLDDRLALFEENIKKEFIRLEQLLGELDSQRRAVESSLANLPSLLSK